MHALFQLWCILVFPQRRGKTLIVMNNSLIVESRILVCPDLLLKLNCKNEVILWTHISDTHTQKLLTILILGSKSVFFFFIQFFTNLAILRRKSTILRESHYFYFLLLFYSIKKLSQYVFYSSIKKNILKIVCTILSLYLPIITFLRIVRNSKLLNK